MLGSEGMNFCGATVCTVDSMKLQHGLRTIYAGFPSSQATGVDEQSYSNFLASDIVRGTHRVPNMEDSSLIGCPSPLLCQFRGVYRSIDLLGGPWVAISGVG